MNIKSVLLSVACVSCYLVLPALATSLLTASAVADGNGLSGAAHRVKRTVYVQAHPGMVQAVHQPVMLQPVQVQHESIALVPVSFITPSYSFTDKIASIFGGISNAVVSKTRAVGDFFRALCGSRPQYVLVNVVTTTTEEPTTETTKCPKTTTTTTTTTTEEPTTKHTTTEHTTTEHTTTESTTTEHTTTESTTTEHTTTEESSQECGEGRCLNVYQY